jgi:hypothetical protein
VFAVLWVGCLSQLKRTHPPRTVEPMDESWRFWIRPFTELSSVYSSSQKTPLGIPNQPRADHDRHALQVPRVVCPELAWLAASCAGKGSCWQPRLVSRGGQVGGGVLEGKRGLLSTIILLLSLALCRAV